MSDEVAPGSHLYWSELQCRDGTTYPLDYREPMLFARLLPAWRAVRAELALVVGRACPIIVHSSFRTIAYNRQIGGSAGSWHCKGAALDCSASPDLAVLPFCLLVARLARRQRELNINGIGYYPEDGICHWDVRPLAHAHDPVVLWRAVYVHNAKTGKTKRVYLPWTGDGDE